MLAFDVPGDRTYQIRHLGRGRRAPAGRVVTAEALKGLPCDLDILPRDAQDRAKLEVVRSLGPEGAYGPTLQGARVVCASPVDALKLLTTPRRLMATLRC